MMCKDLLKKEKLEEVMLKLIDGARQPQKAGKVVNREEVFI